MSKYCMIEVAFNNIEEVKKVVDVLLSKKLVASTHIVESNSSWNWKNRREDNYSTAEMDLSIVGTYAMLKAWDLGIGSCWVRAFKTNDIKNVLELPENINPIFMMPIGYMADDCEPNKELHFSRKNVEDVVEYLV